MRPAIHQLFFTGGGAPPLPRTYADTSRRIHSARRGVAAGASVRVPVLALIIALLIVIPLSGDVDKYEVYAVRFATIANFRVASLVAGADPTRRMDIAMMIWVLKGIDGRVAIVDSGFHREQYFRQFAVKDYLRPSEAIAPLGLKPESVTDLIVSHMHWDHAGGIDLFPNARVWFQEEE